MRVVTVSSILLCCFFALAAAEPPPTYSFEGIAWAIPVAEAAQLLGQLGFSQSPDGRGSFVRDLADRTETVVLVIDGTGTLVRLDVELDFRGRSVEETIGGRRAVTEKLWRLYGRPEEQDDPANRAGEILWPKARDGSLFEVNWNADTDLRLLYRVGAPGYE
jgi:hypothetical protein